MVDTQSPTFIQELMALWKEAKTAIVSAQTRQASQVNPHRRVITFAPGDFVLVHTKNLPIKVPGSRKLKPLWVGPFWVIHAIGTNAYELDLPATLEQLHPVFNISVLKRYKGQVLSPPDPIELRHRP